MADDLTRSRAHCLIRNVTGQADVLDWGGVAEAAGAATVTTPSPGSVDGSGYIGPDPPTAPPAVLSAKAGMIDQSDDGRSAPSGNILR